MDHSYQKTTSFYLMNFSIIHGDLNGSLDLLTGHFRRDSQLTTTTNNDIKNDDRPLEALEFPFQVFLVGLYSMTAILSFVFNAVSVVVIWRYGRFNDQYPVPFLINLAFSDILMAIFTIPFTYTNYMLGQWVFWPFMCPMVNCAQLTTITVSIYTLVAIAFDRYFIINRTTWNRCFKQNRKSIVGLIWLLGMVVGTTQLYVSQVESFVHNRRTLMTCQERWSPGSYQSRIYTIFIFVSTFAMPINIMCLIYSGLFYRIVQYTGSLRTATTTTTTTNNNTANQNNRNNYKRQWMISTTTRSLNEKILLKEKQQQPITTGRPRLVTTTTTTTSSCDNDHQSIRLMNFPRVTTTKQKEKNFIVAYSPQNHHFHHSHHHQQSIQTNFRMIPVDHQTNRLLMWSDNSSRALNISSMSGRHDNGTLYINRKKILKMIIILIVVFVFCWLPIQIFNLLVYFNPGILYYNSSSHHYHFFVGTYFLCHWISSAHSFMNPIIYTFINQNFRDGLKEILFPSLCIVA